MYCFEKYTCILDPSLDGFMSSVDPIITEFSFSCEMLRFTYVARLWYT